MSKNKNRISGLFGGQDDQSGTKKPTQSKKPQKKQERSRAQYDVPKGLTEEISQISKKYKCPASGVAALFLVYGLEAYKRGEINVADFLTETESLKFMYGVDPQYDPEVDS